MIVEKMRGGEGEKGRGWEGEEGGRMRGEKVRECEGGKEREGMPTVLMKPDGTENITEKPGRTGKYKDKNNVRRAFHVSRHIKKHIYGERNGEKGMD